MIRKHCTATLFVLRWRAGVALPTLPNQLSERQATTDIENHTASVAALHATLRLIFSSIQRLDILIVSNYSLSRSEGSTTRSPR